MDQEYGDSQMTVWVHGNPVELADGAWPEGTTPRILVRLAGPIQTAWRAALRGLGLRLRFWCPPCGACVEFPAAFRRDPARLAELDFVVAGCDYAEEFCQRFGELGQSIERSALPGDLFDVICFDRPSRARVARALGPIGALVLQSSTSKLRISYAGTPAVLRDLPGVKLVDPVRLPRLLSIAEVRASVGFPPPPPSAANLDGSGEIVAIADTGLDSGDASTGMHPDFSGRIRALISLPMNASWSGFAVARTDDAADRASGHGTHVAGLLAGSGVASKGLHCGLAPASEVVFLAIEQQVEINPGSGTRLSSGYYLAGRPVDLRELYRLGAAQGAKLHNISWGDASQGAYTDDCFETDLFLREDPAAVVVCAAGNDGVDRDGNRRIDAGSLYSPACAKNVIAVGALEGPLVGRGSRATWGQLDPGNRRWPAIADRNDPVSGEADRIAPFSSCGPTRDGRVKPDLCAPATNLVAARSRSTPYKGWGLADPLPWYMYEGGTSMAAPLVCGALALIRQAWREQARRKPSGAALKALLLLAARPVRGRGSGLAGTYETGFGRLDVGGALPPALGARPGWRVELRDSAVQRVDTGQHRDAPVRLTRVGRLRAVLCWYDPPGERLINDLDLTLIGPDGKVLARGGIPGSGPAAQADRSNPVECIDLPNLPKGRYLLRTSGFNVMDGPQRFALAWCVDTTANSP